MARASLSTKRLLGLDRSGGPPPETLKGQPLRPLTIPNLVSYVRLALLPVILETTVSATGAVGGLLIWDGVTVAAAEEERFTRRKHGKPAVPFASWELPEHAMAFCLAQAGIEAADLDAVAYSYDPDLAVQAGGDITADDWEGLRTLYARRAPRFLGTSLPGLDPRKVRWVPHHVAHAASATLDLLVDLTGSGNGSTR